jgi:hypothetical protein
MDRSTDKIIPHSKFLNLSQARLVAPAHPTFFGGEWNHLPDFPYKDAICPLFS